MKGGSQTGCAWLRLQSSIYMAESMNKDGLFPSSITYITVTEEGKQESGGGWMHWPYFCLAAPACCVPRSTYDRTEFSFHYLFPFCFNRHVAVDYLLYLAKIKCQVWI